MKAKILKETEKAIQISYKVEISCETYHVKSVWMPKSQIEIKSVEGDIMDFEPKNDWILTAKTKDYIKYVESMFHLKYEVERFLYTNSKVDFCWI